MLPEDHEKDGQPEGADVLAVARPEGERDRRGVWLPGQRLQLSAIGDPQKIRTDQHDRRVVAGHGAVAPEDGADAKQERGCRGRHRPDQRAEHTPDACQRGRACQHVEDDEPPIPIADDTPSRRPMVMNSVWCIGNQCAADWSRNPNSSYSKGTAAQPASVSRKQRAARSRVRSISLCGRGRPTRHALGESSGARPSLLPSIGAPSRSVNRGSEE